MPTHLWGSDASVAVAAATSRGEAVRGVVTVRGQHQPARLTGQR